jgi:hypothetical protein
MIHIHLEANTVDSPLFQGPCIHSQILVKQIGTVHLIWNQSTYGQFRSIEAYELKPRDQSIKGLT